MDVAYMDKIAMHNNGVKYLLAAVYVLSRYLRVQPLKTMYANDCVEAFKKMIKTKQPRECGQTKALNSKASSKLSVKTKRFTCIQPKTKPNPRLRKEIFDHLKTLYTDTWKKNRLGTI